MSRLALQGLMSRTDGDRWERTNFRGRPVSLLAGPALVAGLVASSPVPAAAAVAGAGAAALGRYDDTAGAADAAKGLRGHLAALQNGRLSTGAAKLLGLPVVGAAAATLLRPRRPVDIAFGAGVIAGTANVVNLLDLRPGRALKVGLLGGAALADPGVVGSCVALLPGDLAERTMLGDAGANALGATLGVALASRVHHRLLRAAVLAALAALTLTSEVVSFSALIHRCAPLRRLDDLGRLR